MTVNLNQVAITGNLTRDPALVTLPSGHVLCEMQLASHRRSRDEVTGAWQEWPDYFTVKAFGFQARTTHQHLRKGQGVAISGRLSSRRVPETDGRPSHTVEIIAEAVQFLSRPSGR
jgi:single-strand DNA-binding protein